MRADVSTEHAAAEKDEVRSPTPVATLFTLLHLYVILVIMSAPNILRHPIEAFRTAPTPCIGTTVSVGAAAMLASVTPEAEGYIQNVGWSVVAGNIAMAGIGIRLGMRHFSLRHRLERILERGGFDERAMATTTSDWCTRQVARVACENYGHLDKYKTLQEQNSEDAKFSWLPHI